MKFRICVVFVCIMIGVNPLYAQKAVVERQAEEGSVEAQLYLAEKYSKGIDGYIQSTSLALKYYQKAALQGNPLAQWNLCLMLLNGNGIERNEPEAYYWLEKSAKQKFPNALIMLAQKKYVNSEFEECFNLLSDYDNIYEQHPYVLELLGQCYLYGEGTPCNYSKAFDYLGRCVALEMNNDKTGEYFPTICPGNTAYNLGKMYSEGLGTQKDKEIAKKLFNYSISKNRKNILYYEALGEIFVVENDIKNAKKIWETILKIDPDAIKSNSILAMAMGESIDYIIPQTNIKKELTYAVVIANENYKRVPNVPHAINDGMIFRKYLLSTFGVPKENVEYLEDASLNDIKYALANVAQRCSAFKDQVSVIVYYAGHGVPDDKTAEAFLLPVDGFGTDPSSGLNLDDFYASLSEMPAKSVVVLLDACFSGAKRDGGMLMATRGITIKPKMQVPDGKLIVLSATSNDETAFPIEQQKHGLFTYTLLRKIQETGGDITWGELAEHVTETVKNRSIDLNGKLQTPTVSVSQSMKDIWKNIKKR